MASQPQPTIAEDQFGRRMRRERESRGWTQADVAARLRERGVSLHPTAIAKMEQRDVARPRVIRLNEAEAVAEVFGLSVSAMLESRDLLKQAAEQADSWAYLLEALEHASDQFFRTVKEAGAERTAQADVPDAQRSRQQLISGLWAVVQHQAPAASRFRLAAELLATLASDQAPETESAQDREGG